MILIDGTAVIKDKFGNAIEVPCSHLGAINIPRPSECNIWISLFKALRDNFTDEEIVSINNNNWLELQSKTSGMSLEEIIRSEDL